MTAESRPGRRRFVTLALRGLAVAPIVNAIVVDEAHGATTLSESDPAAVAVKYKMDATKAPERKAGTETCSNCALYSGKEGAPEGDCTLFPGKLVAAKGWCASWESY